MKNLSKISLIGAASGWGAQNKLTEEGPLFIEKNFHLLKDEFAGAFIDIFWRKTIQPQRTFKENSKVNFSFIEKEELILNFSRLLSQEVMYSVDEKSFPLVVGGDHSIAIGTWNGIARAKNCYENLGLIWIDAHMDAHTPQTSLSQAIHGMPLALLMGYGSSKIREILFYNKIILNPEHLILIGIRSFEDKEEQLLKRLGVKIYYMEEVQNKGFERVFNEAINYLISSTPFIGLSIDIDSFDPKFAPATASKSRNGILPSDFFITMNKVKLLDIFVCLEIAEYNPSLDKNLITFKLIKNIISLCASY
jgi:arginase